MWDNPRRLNMCAGFLVGLAALAFVLAGLQLLLRSPLWPLREITVLGEPRHTTREELEAALRGRVSGNFFAADLAEVRQAVETLPWVRRANVRRIWPDRLELTIEEHVPLARWGQAGNERQRRALVNTYGERFAGAVEGALPELAGPPGTEAEVARRYERFARILAPLGSPLEQVILTPRFAWQLRLANGLHLVLGRDADAAQARLERFVAVFASTPLGSSGRRYDYVDLRYPNGFALRFTERRS
jgi:cell division protein FtsQ